MSPAATARIAGAIFAVITFAIALGLYAFDSDGAFAVNDGIWYAIGAERFPAESIEAAHPLFHVAVIGAARALERFGVEHPGHVAARLVAGAGGAWLLAQIVALAGRGRVLAGCLFAGTILASRGFIVETAAGENVLPAAAAALFAITLAARPDPSLVGVGAAMVGALLLRQDNVLIVPGIAVAVARGLPPGRRLSGTWRLLLASGLVTLLGYVIAWMVATRGIHRFDHWLPSYGLQPWMGNPGFALESAASYASSVARAATGQTWPIPETRAWLGVGIVAVIALAAVLLRGREARSGLGLPMLVALFAWSVLHAWFEPNNFEWLMLPLAFVAAFGAGLARGAPAYPRALRIAGAALLAGLAAVELAVHLPTTWKLRDRELMSAIEEATGEERSGVQFVAHGWRAHTALSLFGVPAAMIPENRRFEDVLEEHESRASPTVIVLADRLVLSGMPEAEARRKALREPFDALPNTASRRLVRRQGLVCTIRTRPPTPQTRPG